jgi:ABC-type glycerol-3-phosphate transport system substrate-binding protein
MTRRAALKTATAAAALPLVNVRGAGAATTLKVGFWDHWVPGANAVIQKQVEDWGKKNNVTVTLDFITSSGNKLLVTAAAEAQAGTGHDILQFGTWDPHNYTDKLEPVDDVIKALEAKAGPFNAVSQYLAKNKSGNWIAVPTTWGSQSKPCCARISLLKNYVGLDVTQMYPPHETSGDAAQKWTWEGEFLKAAQAASKNGSPFGLGLGQTSDSVDWVGALFTSYGAELVDKSGKPTVNSAAVNQVLDYAKNLVQYLPADAVSYDDASNNRALISGKSALIFNPPSAWAVAKRDAPLVAADCWTFSAPKGPAGRFVPAAYFFLGIWDFSPNKAAAKELIAFLSQREQVEERDNVVQGYDIPPFTSMTDFKVWRDTEPPRGTVYNYPILPSHHAQPNLTGMAASPEFAVQMYNRATHSTMVAKLQSGQSIPQVIAWAKDEIQGFLT